MTNNTSQDGKAQAGYTATQQQQGNFTQSFHEEHSGTQEKYEPDQWYLDSDFNPLSVLPVFTQEYKKMSPAKWVTAGWTYLKMAGVPEDKRVNRLCLHIGPEVIIDLSGYKYYMGITGALSKDELIGFLTTWSDDIEASAQYTREL